MKWPYPVQYGNEHQVDTDVLVLGGGVAGCHAAISAAKKGARVAVVDKASIYRSGSGGAGVDHWHDACTNPCCQVSPEEMVQSGAAHASVMGGYFIGHTAYIACKESWDALLDCEEMGLQFRDMDDEFAGSDFRDDETKVMFAYDYKNRHTVRVRQGANIKIALYNGLKRLGVELHEHIMVTSLLTEGGKPGARVIGATGVHTRTGEFYVFTAKATILATAPPSRIWIFSTELKGGNDEHMDPNDSGDGHAMAWKAGAEFALMEKSGGGGPGGPFGYPAYGIGSAHNTWFACTIVDDNGKEVPWVDKDGGILKTVSERYHPAPGQQFFVLNPGPSPEAYRFPFLIPDLYERIIKGEYTPPFYADLPGMPEQERRAIFGLMVGNEGKTRIAIYDLYTRAGFDPDKDMLQVPGLGPVRVPSGAPQWRNASGGGLVVDWDMRTSLEGLYAGGTNMASSGHVAATTGGRYAGRKAASYARTAAEPVIDRKQVGEEKERVYAPAKRTDGIGWKELQAGVCRIMQDYCGEYKNEETLELGLRWLDSIEESEGARTCARNPHELWRILEVFSRLTVSRIILHASLARQASSAILDFWRIDYPEVDPPEWQKLVTVRLENGEVKAGELPLDYYLQSPYAPTYEENYQRHSDL